MPIKRRVGAALVGWTAVCAWLIAAAPTAASALVTADLLQALTAGVAAVAAFRCAVRDPALRTGWRLVGLSMTAWTVAATVTLRADLGDGWAVATGDTADLAFLLVAPLLSVGAVVLTPRGGTLLGRVRTLLDAAIGGVALLFLGAVVVAHPLLSASEPDLPLLSIAYALNGVLAGTVGTWVLRRDVQGAFPLRCVGLGAALLVIAFGTLANLGLLIAGRYQPGHPLDTMWIAMGALVVFAASGPARVVRVEGRRSAWLRGALPFASALVVSPLLYAQYADIDTNVPLIALAIVLVLLGSARQSLGVLYHGQEAAELARRADARGREMDALRRRFDTIARSMSELVLVLQEDGTLLYVSPSVARLLNLGDEELDVSGLGERLSVPDRLALGHMVLGVFAGDPSTPIVIALRCTDGLHDLEVHAEPVVLAEGEHGVLVRARDVTDRVRVERELRESASTDALTGLPNRAAFVAGVDAAIAERSEESVSVLLVDLDEFKTVNDSLGHHTGDALLRLAAARLEEAAERDVVARLGGDEFAVLLPGASHRRVEELVERVLAAFRRPFELMGLDVYARASVGVAVRRDGWDAGALLQAADTALYAAKAHGRNRGEYFAPVMAEAVHERLSLSSALEGVVERDELELWYQPMIETATGRISSFEALLRWRSPVHGLVSPARFVPLAEEMGLIGELGLWVLGEACARLGDWRNRHPEAAHVTVAVNVSGRQLADPAFAQRVAAALAMADLPPSALTVEITESVTLEGAYVAERVRELHELGVRLALDDFGTGYSSLGSVHRLPFDVLKLDRSFVSPLTAGDDRGLAFLASVAGMAHSLGMRTVAEGVETHEHLDAVAAAGIDKAQGFLIGRPAPAVEVERLFAARAADAPRG